VTSKYMTFVKVFTKIGSYKCHYEEIKACIVVLVFHLRNQQILALLAPKTIDSAVTPCWPEAVGHSVAIC